MSPAWEPSEEIRWLELKPLLDRRAYCQPVLAHLQARRYTRILDCGTGLGALARRLSRLVQFDHLIGLDSEPDLIDEARQRTRDARISFRQGDATSLPFEDEHFDLVMAQALLEHLDPGKLRDALSEMRRVLTPGGLAYFPMNYDRDTIFEPTQDYVLEDQIIANFNRYTIGGAMFGDEGGNARCGRQLWHLVTNADLRVLWYDACDWVLYPKFRAGGQLAYSGDECTILELLIALFYRANLNPRIPAERRVPSDRLKTWRDLREHQLANNELVYMCRQNTILAEKLTD